MEDKQCNLNCFYDKELKVCGGCDRTLEQIAEAGRKKKYTTREDGHTSITYNHKEVINKVKNNG